MKKLVIVLIALTTLAIFVACNPAKDPVKDNLAIGNWEAEDEDYSMTYYLEVKNDKTASLTAKHDSDIVGELTGTWTATSINEGSFSLAGVILGDEEKFEGPFKVESSILTVIIEEEPIEFKKAVK